MVICCILKCGKRTQRDKGVRFFKVPAVIHNSCQKTFELSQERRNLWIQRISRVNFPRPKQEAKVCSLHFVSGQPAKSFDRYNIDWAPTLNLGHDKVSAPTLQSALQVQHKRHKRAIERHSNKSAARRVLSEIDGNVVRKSVNDNSSVMDQSVTTNDSNGTCNMNETNFLQQDYSVKDFDPKNSDSITTTVTSPLVNIESFEPMESTEVELESVGANGVHNLENCLSSEIGKKTVSVSCQTDFTGEYISQLELDNKAMRAELHQIKQDALSNSLTEESLKNNNTLVNFYTGLPTFGVLMIIFKLAVKNYSQSHRNSLPPFSEFLLTLIKLRLNVPLKDLAVRFKIDESTACRIFHKWIDRLYVKLQPFVKWPERELLWANMPIAFKEAFGKNVAIIIDCFEVFIDTPSAFVTRAATWSYYKNHHTIKFLVGITPLGTVAFISDGWGGRTSDKHLTENCGFLEKLLPGDVILADRGFTISDAVGFYNCKLVIPAFMRGKEQLSQLDTERSRKIASLRIHVERVIGLLRMKYSILNSQIPIEFLESHDGSPNTLDKIAFIGSALINFNKGIVSLIKFHRVTIIFTSLAGVTGTLFMLATGGAFQAHNTDVTLSSPFLRIKYSTANIIAAACEQDSPSPALHSQWAVII
ncbi:hypothetical protein B566_EDAN008607 [Ephemera danica]|nr:hypothetical protein B566_EDAN008607 [Ephemera danica]